MNAGPDAPPRGGRGDVGSIGHLEAIHRLTAATVAASSVESIHEAALDILIAALPIDRAAVLLFDPDGVLRFKAWRGLSGGYRASVEGHSPWSPDDDAPRDIVIEDVAADRTLGTLREVVLAEGIHAVAFIPLLYGSRLLGKLMLYADSPRRFDAAELALARTAAGHVAFASEKRRLEDELRLSAEKLEATLNAVSEAITVQAPGGGLLLANKAAADMLGFDSVAALLEAGTAKAAARLELLDEDGRPLPVDRLPGRDALQGRQPPEMLVRWRVAGTDTERVSLLKATPVLDATGNVRFAVNVFRDVTDRQLALEALRASETHLAFLASASRRLLTTSLEPDRVLQEVTELVVPQLADWCLVGEFARNGGLIRAAAGPRHLEREEPLVSLLRCHDVVRDHPVVSELAAGRTVVVTPTILEQLGRDDENIERVRDLGVSSLVLVPLRMRGRVIGIMSLAAGPGRPAFNDVDVALADELAARVAAAVANARSFANERATAETLARALLPGHLPDIPGLEVAARYQTAGDVGGDFYDCFPIGGGTWLLVVGDVCGRGIQAASMTGLTRHTIRAAALHAGSPAAVLADLNQVLLDAAGERMAAWLPKGQQVGPSFCTVCLAAVTPGEGGAEVIVSSAGHPLPFVVRSNGDVQEVGRAGSLLGVMTELEISDEPCRLGPGDALVLFTDGITERRSGGRLFEEEMATILTTLACSPAADVARGLEEAAVAFADEAPDDDMAVLAVSVSPVPVTLPDPADHGLQHVGVAP